jgi:hypothetical protein
MLHPVLREISCTLVVPAGEAHLPKLKVDGVGLIAARSLAMREEEVRERIPGQWDAPAFQWCGSNDLVLRLDSLGRRTASWLGSD